MTRLSSWLFAGPDFLIRILSSCNKSPQTENHSQTKPVTRLPPIDLATTATISGVVNFEGAPPAPEKIDMSADPACRGENSWQPLIVDNGHLANVLVYVKDGLGERTFDAPSTVVPIEQKGCAYRPNVAAVMAGQSVQFLDSDQTMHNIHPVPENDKEWNQAEHPDIQPITRTFQNPELMIPSSATSIPG